MKNKYILLVEDNPDDEELTMMSFKKSGLVNEVVVMRDGEKAVQFLFAEGPYKDRNPAALPAVVLLDLKLPKLSGLEVLEQLRTNPLTKCVPVAILTSSSEEEDVINSYKLGANSFVRKPVDFNQFADAVKTIGLYWLLINEPPVMDKPDN